MCLSAPASFIAGAILATMGTALACRVKSKRLLPLAFIPWFFAIQQCAEGIVWLYLPEAQQSYIAIGAKDLFLFFAFVFWPLWIPFSLWFAETNQKRKQGIAACFGMGLMQVALLACTIPYVTAVSYRSNIQYLLELNHNHLLMGKQFSCIMIFFYAVATLLPLFLSSLKKMWVLGICVACAGIAIYLIDHHFFVSLWCFFAAWISLCLFFILPKMNTP